MRLATYSVAGHGYSRLGAVLPDDNTTLIDLNWAYTSHLMALDRTPAGYAEAARRLPADMLGFLRAGAVALAAAREAIDFAAEQLRAGATPTGPAGERVVCALEDVTLHAPVPRPGKILAAGRNFGKHLADSAAAWSEQHGQTISAGAFPSGFIKVSSSVIGPYDAVIAPRDTDQLDYEIELAIVIGQTAKRVRPEDAYEYIAGYTVFNDISARDWQIEETKSKLLALGKNFDTFGPMGPWLVTKDEIDDPHDLEMNLRVNGETRQNSNTKHMIHTVPELVAHWSKMTLEPGDVLATGTPEGVALHRKPDPTPWFLTPGDVVEAEIAGIGRLENPIVAE